MGEGEGEGEVDGDVGWGEERGKGRRKSENFSRGRLELCVRACVRACWSTGRQVGGWVGGRNEKKKLAAKGGRRCGWGGVGFPKLVKRNGVADGMESAGEEGREGGKERGLINDLNVTPSLFPAGGWEHHGQTGLEPREKGGWKGLG